jgi:hypothetical protein
VRTNPAVIGIDRPLQMTGRGSRACGGAVDRSGSKWRKFLCWRMEGTATGRFWTPGMGGWQNARCTGYPPQGTCLPGHDGALRSSQECLCDREASDLPISCHAWVPICRSMPGARKRRVFRISVQLNGSGISEISIVEYVPERDLLLDVKF